MSGDADDLTEDIIEFRSNSFVLGSQQELLIKEQGLLSKPLEPIIRPNRWLLAATAGQHWQR